MATLVQLFDHVAILKRQAYVNGKDFNGFVVLLKMALLWWSGEVVMMGKDDTEQFSLAVR
jgi:hypothetical protein